jgi:DNA-binding transcriptional ArsR family regulator
MTYVKHRTLRTDAEIRAYLNHTRMDILAELRNGPATGSQLGERLGVHPANLTRHIRTLVEAGLAELVEKRDTGRNLEKYYAATADSFDVEPQATLDSPHKVALDFVRSDVSAALIRLADDDPRPVVALLAGARISEDDAAAFHARLSDLISEFQATDRSDGTSYHLNLSLYPGDLAAPECARIELSRSQTPGRESSAQDSA